MILDSNALLHSPATPKTVRILVQVRDRLGIWMDNAPTNKCIFRHFFRIA